VARGGVAQSGAGGSFEKKTWESVLGKCDVVMDSMGVWLSTHRSLRQCLLPQVRTCANTSHTTSYARQSGTV
jgi:hypothetical protein